jgi:hypothetical protein
MSITMLVRSRRPAAATIGHRKDGGKTNITPRGMKAAVATPIHGSYRGT